MGTILSFRAPVPPSPGDVRRCSGKSGDVVIFPGVRIERHEVDLSHRVRDTVGLGEFDDLGGKRHPRKTS